MASTIVEKRQGSAFDGNYPYYGDDGYGSWWWSTSGMAVRYTIVAALFLLVIGYFLGGYIHARSRLRKGLQPLAYHRWMVRRQMYYAAAHPNARAWPHHGSQPGYTHNAYGGTMPRHAYPPPAYNADQPPPPVYAEGQNGGKNSADQRFGGPTNREGESSSGNPLPAAPNAPGQTFERYS